MTIDITKIRPGDKVTLVPLEVHSAPSKDGVFFVRDYVDVACFTSDQIAAHHPAPREFQVGDRVRYSGGGVGTIRGIDGDQAWVRWDDSEEINYTYLISSLTLVEGGE